MGKMKTPIEHYHAQGYKYEYPRARKELNKDSGWISLCLGVRVWIPPSTQVTEYGLLIDISVLRGTSINTPKHASNWMKTPDEHLRAYEYEYKYPQARKSPKKDSW